MSRIARWLGEHGLEKYAGAFDEAEIDLAALPHLTEDDLKQLGLPIGPRRRALAAIAMLASSKSASVAPRATTPRPEPERRQVTVVFADVVGSTAMAQRMDPEELRAVIRDYQDVATAAIARYEGHVAKYMGDGVLAYFGWPRAHEDDAERAVRASLALNAAMAARPSALALRIGIATGVVVVGDVVGEGSAREDAAVGETLHLAARLQQVAAPGAIVVSASTQALLGNAFELEGLGLQALKGMTAPVEAWRVLRDLNVETRFEAAHGPRLGHLVGREHELALALDRWERARAGEGQLVLLRAEPGIGKSRLAAELRTRLAPQTSATLSYQGSPHHGSSSLYPVIQQLLRAAQIESDDALETKLAKLSGLAARSGVDAARATALLASLLALPVTGAATLLTLTPQQQKTETLSLLGDLLAGLCAAGPVLLLIEDLHWFDPTTRELLDQVAPRIETLPMLMVATFRPEIATPWEGLGHTTLIPLNRLARRQVEAQIAEIAGLEVLSADVIEQIVAKSDGVPLFVEELTKAALELSRSSAETAASRPDVALAPLSVPISLRASLLARLDRLPAAREIAQIGAALGREFDFDLLAAVAPQGQAQAAAALHDLHRAELIFPRGTPPGTRWSFKHALIQEAAYETLLKTSRAELHARIAETIVTRFAALAQSEPETVARHYEGSGNARRAGDYWANAGRLALGRYAGAEAVQHFSRALDSPGASTDRSFRLDLEISLGEALVVVGRLSDAKARLPKLAAEARENADYSSMARTGIAIAVAELNSGSTQRSTIALLEETLEGLASDAPLRLNVMNALSRGLAMLGEPSRAWSIADDVVARARVLGDQRALVEALQLRFFVPIGLTPDQIADYQRVGRELVAATETAGAAASIVNVLTQQIYWNAQFGDIGLFRSSLAAYVDYARSLRVGGLIAVGIQARAMEAILLGDLALAERLATEALDVGQHEYGGMAHGIYGIQMFTIRREQGRLGEVAGLFKQFVDEAGEGSAWEPGFALLASDLGFEAPARRILHKHVSRGFELPSDGMRTATLAFFAEAAVRLRDRDAAKRIYELLLPYQHMTVTVGFTVVCYGAASRFLGLLADLLEDRESAETHFQRALAMNEQMQAWPWLAHTQADYAAALRRWGGVPDLARADGLATAAMATALRLGLALLQRKLALLQH